MKVKWNSISLLIVFVVVLATARCAGAALECEARSGSCLSGYTNMFQLQQSDNSHASSDNSYPIKICCRYVSPSISISGSCSGTCDVMLRLSAPNNAHAEKNTMTTSGYSDICIGSSDSRVYNVDCNYRAGSCDSGYACVAKISGDINAHLSDCSQSNGYESVCCKADADITAPTTTIDPDGQAWTTNDVDFTLTCDDDPVGCQTTYYKIIDDGQPCGTTGYSSGNSGTVSCASGSACEKRVCYYSVDNGGNTETTETSNVFHIDKEEPTTTPVVTSGTAGSNNWWLSDVDITLGCYDGSGSGCDETWHCIDQSDSCGPNILSASLTVTNEGTNYVRFYSTDMIGNTELVKSFEVKIDKTPPETSASALGTVGSNGWYISDVLITLSCTDAVSGCNEMVDTNYCIDQSNSCTPNTPYSGQFIMTAEGTNYVRFSSVDRAGNQESPNSLEVRIDKQAPTAWVDPLPEWTNSTDGSGNVYFQVAWGGDDGTGSGVASYEVQYRILDRASGTYVNNHCGGSAWCPWHSDTASGTKVFGPIAPVIVSNFNNHSFLFRIRATDNAGNTRPYDDAGPYSSTSIDVVAPVCTVEDLPDWQATNTFNVIFNAVEGESSMARFEGLVRGPYGTGGWRDISDNCINLTPMDDADTVTLECTLNLGEWEFGCRGTDHSGNTGIWSPVENTTVDTNEAVVHITEPDSEWWCLDELTLSWYTTASDVDHYDIYYYNTAWPDSLDPLGWQHWNTYSSSVTSTTFGAGGTPPVNLVEGQTYYVNVTSTDYAGNQDSDYVNLTIDRTPPVIYINVTDQDGNPIPSEWIPSGSGVELINITSNASDELSGILNNTIEYMVYGEAPYHKWLECGEGPSPGYSVCSTAGSNPSSWEDITYNDRTSARYRILTKDRAGNENITSYYFTVSHPLANFGSTSLHIYLGDTRLVPLMVRNVQDQVDNITINLTGYPFAEFEYNCDPSDCIISTETESMVALNVNPYDERRYYVRVMSSEPGEDILNLTAKSLINPLLNDSHSITIRTSYPAYFPGLGTWAIVLLLVIAGFVYGALSRNEY